MLIFEPQNNLTAGKYTKIISHFRLIIYSIFGKYIGLNLFIGNNKKSQQNNFIPILSKI